MQLIADAAASKAVEKQSANLRAEMQSVAVNTAEMMATKLSAQLNDRMREMEGRLRTELSTKIDSSIRDSLGMTRDDHIQQHRQIGEAIEGYRSVNRVIWTNIIKAVGAVAVVGFLGTAAQSEMPAVLQNQVERPATTYHVEAGK